VSRETPVEPNSYSVTVHGASSESCGAFKVPQSRGSQGRTAHTRRPMRDTTAVAVRPAVEAGHNRQRAAQ